MVAPAGYEGCGVPVQATGPGLGLSQWHHSSFHLLLYHAVCTPRNCSREFSPLSTVGGKMAKKMVVGENRLVGSGGGVMLPACRVRSPEIPAAL